MIPAKVCLIIGAGPTGLAAAYRLQELGVSDWLLIDKEAEAGGLAGSVVDDNGFTWDMGGHVQFSHYQTFDEYMVRALGLDGWLHHQRESWVWMSGRFVPYPFQNNLHRLPSDQRWKCVEGLLQAHGRRNSHKPENFQQWIDQTFGAGVAEVFLNPYNFKVWAYAPAKLNSTWIGERVSVPPIERVLKAVCLEQDDVSWGPNNTFQFPKHGGTGAIWRSLFNQLPRDRVRLETGLVRIDGKRRTAYLSNGETFRYESLISTIPVDLLAGMLDDPELLATAQSLTYSSTHVIGIGLKGQPPEHLKTKCWMYFPEDDCPFYRVTVFSNYSPYNVPDPENNWSLMAEVSESECKSVDASQVVEDTIQGLMNTGMMKDRDAIICTWHRRLEHGYPTPSLKRDEVLSVLLPGLEKCGIYSRGRFGAWKYEVSNQDHSFAQGREAVERILGRIDQEAGAEPTLNRPDWVNGRRNP